MQQYASWKGSSNRHRRSAPFLKSVDILSEPRSQGKSFCSVRQPDSPYEGMEVLEITGNAGSFGQAKVPKVYV